MITFKEWNENRKPYVYQTTYLINVESVFQSKLMAAAGASPWEKGHLQKHSKKGIFFSDNVKGIKYWVWNLIEQSYNISDYPYEANFIPIILKFKLNVNSWQKDKLGNLETDGNFFTKKSINPLGIVLWDGSKWTSDPEDAYNIKNYFSDEDYQESNYPYPKVW